MLKAKFNLRLKFASFRAPVAIGAGAAIAALIAPTFASADAQDAFNFVGGASVRYEDNLFRVDSRSDARALLGKSQMSDWIYSANAGIKIDKLYAQQRFQLDVVAMHNQHQTYDFLDFDAVNYRGAWLWHLTPHISGVLSADQQQTLTSFSDFRGSNLSTPALQRRNVQTNESRIFSIDGEIGAGIHLLGGASELRSRNSQTFTPVGDYVQDGVELGIKYIAPSDNYVSLVQREIKGTFNGRTLNSFSQLDTGFDQSETEAKAAWKLTGKSELNGRLIYIDRKHDHFSARDFSGLTGNLTYRWTPTGKLYIDTSLARNLSSFQEFTNSYYQADTLSIAPTWAATAKTKISLKGLYSERDFHGAIIPVAEMRKDKIRSLSLSADWLPTRTITVNGTVQHESRTSNFTGLDYTANSIGLSAQLQF